MKLKREAVAMLRQVKRMVLAEPKRLHMGTWKETKEEPYLNPPRGFPKCGTVGCIGGWVETLYQKQHPRSQQSAHEILGFAFALENPAAELFYPKNLMNAKNPQTAAHARATAKHIDRFIKKYS